MAKLAVTAIVALDVATSAKALALVDRLGDACSFYKIGSELFTAAGPSVVAEVRGRGKDVFLDLKFHDIPNTVRAAVASAARLGVRLVTVHASGGRRMLEAAVAGAGESAVRGAGETAGQGAAHSPCKVLAVSVLTSLAAPDLGEIWGRGSVDVEAEVLRLARSAAHAGIHGLVCSAHEAAAVRQQLGPRFELLVPGIRLAGSAGDDQARVATPTVAIHAGATYLVLGRTVTAEPDPRAAMERANAEIEAAAVSLRSDLR